MIVKVEFNISEVAALQQLLDLALQKEGLKVAQVALALNDKITSAVQEARDSNQ